MRGKVLGAAVVLLGLAAGAWAGRTNYFETSVDPAGRIAYGSFYDTRATPDNVQFIACAVYAVAGGVPTVACQAKDLATDALSCSSTDPVLVQVAQGISDNGYIYFRCAPGGATATALEYLYVTKGSIWHP
jgi:hypothetical protein